MTPPLLFWAQNLDNVGPDHFAQDATPIDEDDAVRSQRIVGHVADVARGGAVAYEFDAVTVRARDADFTVEVISAERDVRGRRAPILCYGAFPDEPATDWPDTVVAGVAAFMRQIGRDPTPDRMAAVRDGLVEAKEKKKRARTIRLLLIGAAVGAAALTVWALLRN